MPNKIIASVGREAKNLKKFYWEIKTADEREIVCKQSGFDSLEEARTNLEEFRSDLANSIIIVNQ
jgi:hypothetical protein